MSIHPALPTLSVKYEPFETKLTTHSKVNYVPFGELFSDRIDTEKYHIATVNNKRVYASMNTHLDISEFLHKTGEQSPVGVGSETVVDLNIRSSKEFTDFQLTADFKDMITEAIGKAIREGLNGGKLISATPHKFITYGEGDFFKEHVDSIHTPGQTLTAVFVVNSENNSCLCIDGKGYSEAGLYVFYHDVPHEVLEEYSGGCWRHSMTFDIVVDTNEIIPEVDDEEFVTELIERIKKTGAKKFGYFSPQLNTSEDDTSKGVDAYMQKIFEGYVKSSEQVQLRSPNGDYYHNRVTDLYKFLSPIGDSMMCDLTYEDEIVYETNNTRTRWGSFEEWSIRYDEYNDLIAIKDEYRLGDVLVLYTEFRQEKIMEANDEIILGNECLQGEIYEAVFNLFELE